MPNTVNLLFAATVNYLPYAVVTALSAKDKLNPDYNLKMFFLYADVVNKTPEQEKNNIFEMAVYTLAKHNIEYEFIDIQDKMYMLEGLSLGMWGEISLTHYMYLLAPLVVNVNQVVFLDTDIIVNCDLSVLQETDLGNHLLAMGEPRGFEEMGDDVSNSGVVILNLTRWRQENTLNTLLKFGKKLPPAQFCDQRLLYEYFTIKNPNRLLLVDKMYNIFPTCFANIPLEDIKIFHFTGINDQKPWKIQPHKQRASFLWWDYARQTTFYEDFIYQKLQTELKKQKRIMNEILNMPKYKKKFKKYKLLSKITIGKTRTKYKEKRKEFKKKIFDIHYYLNH